MATKSMAYEHPTYVVRQALPLPVTVANTISAKFTAWTAMLVMSITLTTQVAGTSTTTFTATGTATTATPTAQFNAYRVYNTGSLGGAIALATTTYGPFAVGGTAVNTNAAALGVSTAAGVYGQGGVVGGSVTTPINTALTGGGIAINQGDQFYILPVDATYTALPSWEVGVLPLANVTL